MEAAREKSVKRIRAGNAPCSWGLIGQGAPEADWSRMLDELAAAGYTGTELGDYGFMPVEPELLRAELEKRSLALLGAFFGLDLRNPEIVGQERGRLLRLLRLLAEGAPAGSDPYLVLADADGLDPVRSLHAGRITPGMGMEDDEWAVFLKNSNEVASFAFAEAGIRTVFHPHCAGFVETPDETRRFLEGTAPERVGLVFDTGHYVYGTGKPDPDGLAALAGLREFRTRIPYVHFKDVSAEVAARARAEGWNYLDTVRAGLYAELGEGSIDFGALVEELGRDGYSGWITVEQDVLPGMGTPLASAIRNRKHLQSLGI